MNSNHWTVDRENKVGKTKAPEVPWPTPKTGAEELAAGVGRWSDGLIGALIMAVLRNGPQQMGWPTYF